MYGKILNHLYTERFAFSFDLPHIFIRERLESNNSKNAPRSARSQKSRGGSVAVYWTVGVSKDLTDLEPQLSEFRVQFAESFCCTSQHVGPSGQVLACDRQLIFEAIRLVELGIFERVGCVMFVGLSSQLSIDI
jgi:hypothetical protein